MNLDDIMNLETKKAMLWLRYEHATNWWLSAQKLMEQELESYKCVTSFSYYAILYSIRSVLAFDDINIHDDVVI